MRKSVIHAYFDNKKRETITVDLSGAGDEIIGAVDAVIDALFKTFIKKLREIHSEETVEGAINSLCKDIKNIANTNIEKAKSSVKVSNLGSENVENDN